MSGIVLVLVGIAAVVGSGILTRRYITGMFGSVDSVTTRMSEGTGVVPSWVSLINLAGWGAVVVGAVVAVASL